MNFIVCFIIENQVHGTVITLSKFLNIATSFAGILYVLEP